MGSRETLGLAAYRVGKTDEARKLFEQMLSDRMTPPAVSERALLMLALLTDAEAAKAAATAPTKDAAKDAAGQSKAAPVKPMPAQSAPSAPKKK